MVTNYNDTAIVIKIAKYTEDSDRNQPYEFHASSFSSTSLTVTNIRVRKHGNRCSFQNKSSQSALPCNVKTLCELLGSAFKKEDLLFNGNISLFVAVLQCRKKRETNIAT